MHAHLLTALLLAALQSDPAAPVERATINQDQAHPTLLTSVDLRQMLSEPGGDSPRATVARADRSDRVQTLRIVGGGLILAAYATAAVESAAGHLEVSDLTGRFVVGGLGLLLAAAADWLVVD